MGCQQWKASRTRRSLYDLASCCQFCTPPRDQGAPLAHARVLHRKPVGLVDEVGKTFAVKASKNCATEFYNLTLRGGEGKGMT